MGNSVSPQRMKKIDPISYDLWQRFVEPFVRGNIDRTTEMKTLFAGGPGPFHPHPVVQKIVKNETGVREFQEAMMTWVYLASMCRYYEGVLKRA